MGSTNPLSHKEWQLRGRERKREEEGRENILDGGKTAKGVSEKHEKWTKNYRSGGEMRLIDETESPWS